MSQEEQNDILASVRRRRCEAKQRLACHRIKADEISEKLRKVADRLPEGRKEDHALMLATPSADTVSTLRQYIQDEMTTIAKCDEQLEGFVQAVRG